MDIVCIYVNRSHCYSASFKHPTVAIYRNNSVCLTRCVRPPRERTRSRMDLCASVHCTAPPIQPLNHLELTHTCARVLCDRVQCRSTHKLMISSSSSSCRCCCCFTYSALYCRVVVHHKTTQNMHASSLAPHAYRAGKLTHGHSSPSLI